MTGRGGDESDKDDCQDCGACVGRRDFLVGGLGAVLAALVPTALRAAPVEWVEATGTGNVLRYPVPAADGVQIDRPNELILVRYQGTVAAFALSCPHQRSMLRWRDKDGIFRCTKHHSEYTPLGVFQKGRATRNMDRMAVELVAGEVVVDPSRIYHSDEDGPGWQGAVVAAP